MSFKNYCIIALGDIKGVREELENIRESRFAILESKSVIIATFFSSFSAIEITELFTLLKKNVIVFEVKDGSYGVNLKDVVKQKQLFPDNISAKSNDDIADELNAKLANDLLSDLLLKDLTDKSIHSFMKFNEIPIENIRKTINTLSDDDKVNKLNTFLDKGVENLNEYDKTYLDLLTKSFNA